MKTFPRVCNIPLLRWSYIQLFLAFILPFITDHRAEWEFAEMGRKAAKFSCIKYFSRLYLLRSLFSLTHSFSTFSHACRAFQLLTISTFFSHSLLLLSIRNTMRIFYQPASFQRHSIFTFHLIKCLILGWLQSQFFSLFFFGDTMVRGNGRSLFAVIALYA